MNFESEQDALTEDLSNDEKLWATLCHIAAYLVFVLPGVGHIIGPLIVWLIKRNEFEFVDWQGREALNFQISCTLYAIGAGFLVFLVVGIFLLIALFIAWFILVIVASINANNGNYYQYPFCIHFL